MIVALLRYLRTFPSTNAGHNPPTLHSSGDNGTVTVSFLKFRRVTELQILAAALGFFVTGMLNIDIDRLQLACQFRMQRFRSFHSFQGRYGGKIQKEGADYPLVPTEAVSAWTQHPSLSDNVFCQARCGQASGLSLQAVDNAVQ